VNSSFFVLKYRARGLQRVNLSSSFCSLLQLPAVLFSINKSLKECDIAPFLPNFRYLIQMKEMARNLAFFYTDHAECHKDLKIDAVASYYT
jgi:hypothetical protein